MNGKEGRESGFLLEMYMVVIFEGFVGYEVNCGIWFRGYIVLFGRSFFGIGKIRIDVSRCFLRVML